MAHCSVHSCPPSPLRARYGTWDSPITTETLTARCVTLSQVRIDGRSTWWVEAHSQERGRHVLMRRNPLGVCEEVLPMIDGVTLPNVRTFVHEYGGRAYAINDGVVVFSHGDDHRVWLYDLSRRGDGLIALTPFDQRRYGDFELAPVRSLVYAVCEDHRGDAEPVNSLVAIPLDGSAARGDEPIRTIFSGTDFVSSPTLSPDGTKLAWLTWNHPQMPWTQSQLHVGSLDFHGNVTSIKTIVDEPGVCVYEPRWTLAGDLIHVDDSSGWANLYRTEGFTWRDDEEVDAWQSRLRTRRLHPSSKAFSHPHWQLGLHSYDNFDDQHLICSWSEDGHWHLGTVRLDNGELEQWDLPWWPVGNVACADSRVVLLADSATSSPTIVEVEDAQVRPLRASTYDPLESRWISQAESISWPTRDGEVAHGFFYPPVSPNYAGGLSEAERPPLIVMVHGGPTSAARPGLDLAKQFWTSRGFAIVDVNHRGSTGYGRAYREALDGQWGVIDVDDCADAVKFLAQRGDIDPNHVAIRGGSAGGFTVLCALCRHSEFTAGTSLYGIADLSLLGAHTHKFESHYLLSLLGVGSLGDPLVAQRSPINHIDRINAPVLLLQGEHDQVVPADQARLMERALRGRGGEVELRLYPGEGHGFREASTISDALEAELAFYRRVWGL